MKQILKEILSEKNNKILDNFDLLDEDEQLDFINEAIKDRRGESLTKKIVKIGTASIVLPGVGFLLYMLYRNFSEAETQLFKYTKMKAETTDKELKLVYENKIKEIKYNMRKYDSKLKDKLKNADSNDKAAFKKAASKQKAQEDKKKAKIAKKIAQKADAAKNPSKLQKFRNKINGKK